MKLSLVVQTPGKSAGQAIPIPSAQFIIGRDPQCNLRPASVMISKRHCAVLVRNNNVFLRDFGSTNGTFLNNEPVKGEVPIKDGDLLKVGPLEFKISIQGAASPAPSKPTPPPQPKKDIMDDDAAAMLLNLDDDEGVTVSPTTAETEDAVPGGTTVMEIPVMPQPAESQEETKPAAAEAKPAPKPEDAKKKNASGLAQDAAKAILDKMAKGRRR